MRLIISLLTLPVLVYGVTFKDDISFDDIKIFNTDRLTIKLSRKKEDYSVLYALCCRNINSNNYFYYFFQNTVNVDEDYMADYVNDNYQNNIDFFDDFATKKSTVKDESIMFFIFLKEEEKLIGTLQLFGKEHIMLGIFIDATYSNKRYATEAIEASLKFVQTFTVHSYAIFDCFEHNVASNKIAQRLDFLLISTEKNEKGNLKIYQKCFE